MSGFLPENPGVIKMYMIAEIRRLHFVENETVSAPENVKVIVAYDEN